MVATTYARAMSRLGLVALCPPLLSLCQGRLGLDLVPSLQDFLAFYRDLADAVLDVLYRPSRWAFGEDPSRLVRDLHVLSFLGWTLYLQSERVLHHLRAEGARFAEEDADAERRPMGLVQRVVTTYVCGLGFLGLPWLALVVLVMMPVYAIAKVRSHLMGGRGALPLPANEAIARGDVLARQGWILLLAVVAFFAVSWIERAAGG